MDHLIAYLDAGSGSLIVQVAIASIVAVPFFLRTQITRGLAAARSRLRRTGSRTDPSS